MDIVYVETTVIGNIAGRLHPDANIASRQRITREWWATATSLYQIVTSRLTLDECGDGDPAAARERLDILNGIPLLNESSDAEMLAELLIEPQSSTCVGTARCIAHRNCCYKRCTIHSDVELQAYSQSALASSDCRNMQRRRFYSARHLHS